MAPTRISIQHVSGPKANQIEQFPLASYSELTIGRDPGCNINFDPQRDEYVSRHHAIIRVESGDQPNFKIADLGSRNGTRVNGEPITADTELLPDDVVELGAGGPKFKFDVQPRPTNMIGRTRALPKAMGETKMLNVGDIEAAAKAVSAPSSSAPAKSGVGRNTVIGMLTAQRAETNRNWMYVLAGVLVLVAVGGGGLYWQSKTKAEAAAAELAKHEVELAAQKQAAIRAQEESALKLAKAREESAAAVKQAEATSVASLQKAVGMTPQEVVRKYGDATVVIDVQWRLYDAGSGKPLFHRMMTQPDGKTRLPAYIKLANGTIVRWLTTDDEKQTNRIVGLGGRGSGFVISKQGFILTNKHVVAGWLTSAYGDREGFERGVVYDIRQIEGPRLFDPTRQSELLSWIPDKGAVFRADVPIPVDNNLHTFEGRSDTLDVRFPGQQVSVAARFVRASPESDVAVIKVDSEQELSTVELSSGALVPVGEQVTVLGYPSFSVQSVAVISSNEGGQVRQRAERIPEPTVTMGNVSRMSEAAQRTGTTTTLGLMGELYQLTVPSGAGNSGGPVFDHDGKVIGIFTYGSNRETTTFAVPIRFGVDLFKVQRSQQ